MKMEYLEINKIETDINKILSKYLFEPNNEETRNNIKKDIDYYLDKYKDKD